MTSAVLLTVLLASAGGEGRMKPLHLFDVVSGPGVRLDGEKMPRVTVVFSKATAVQELMQREPKPAPGTEGTIVVEDARVLHAVDAPTDAQRKPSFMIDYDEPAFAPVTQEIATLGASPTALRDLVNKYISNKSGERGFDPASVVARRKEGDCTEHAVLLAAAARSAGLPSRVVLGIVLVQGKKEVGGMGHAWTEIHDGTGWKVYDAALADDAHTKVYLPLTVVRNEGPGYRLTGAAAMNVRQVRLEAR